MFLGNFIDEPSRRSVTKIETPLPSWVIKIEGKLYNVETGKEIPCVKMTLKEFLYGKGLK